MGFRSGTEPVEKADQRNVITIIFEKKNLIDENRTRIMIILLLITNSCW